MRFPCGTFEASLVFRFELAEPIRPFIARLPVEITFGTAADMEEVATLTPHHHAGVLRDRLEAGNICFLARRERRIVGFNWLILTRAVDAYYRIVLRPGDVYCMDAFTQTDVRGHGIHTELLYRILVRAKELGRERAFTRVSPTNSASWKSHMRLGWHRAGTTFAFRPRGAASPAGRIFGPTVYPLQPMRADAPY